MFTDCPSAKARLAVADLVSIGNDNYLFTVWMGGLKKTHILQNIVGQVLKETIAISFGIICDATSEVCGLLYVRHNNMLTENRLESYCIGFP